MAKDHGGQDIDTLHPELQQLFAKRGPPPPLPVPTRATVPQFRKQFAAQRKRYNESAFVKSTLPCPPTWTEKDISIPLRDGTSIPARVYLPTKPTSSDGVPVVVFFHGGGWFMGDVETEAHDCQVICARTGAAVINVAYRLYPDVDFPVPITDSYDAVKFVAAQHASLGTPDCRLSPAAGFIVAGSSGGGTWATIICHLARDDNLQPPLTGCHVTCPILTELDEVRGIRIFGPERYKSSDRHKDAILMNLAMERAIKSLGNFPGHSPLLTPFHSASHHSLPPTAVQVAGIDPWRDGGVIYAEELAKAGVATRLDVYPGLPHLWWTTFPAVSASRDRFEDLASGVEWLLRGGRDGTSGHEGGRGKARARM